MESGLIQKIYHCPCCDRDHNASLNILRLGTQSLGSAIKAPFQSLIVGGVFTFLPSTSYAAEAYDVYCYGNLEYIKSVLRGVSLLMGSSGLQSLLLLILLMGLMYAIGTNLLRPGVHLQYLFTAFLIYSILLVPKANVMITDLTVNPQNNSNNPNCPPRPPQPPQPSTELVSDVPLGLAFFASATSTAGKWLTEKTDQAFSLPESLKYSKAKMLQHFSNILFIVEQMGFCNYIETEEDAKICTQINIYYQECFFPYFASMSNKDIKEVYTTSDLLSKINVPFSTATSYSLGPDQPTLTCTELYNQITNNVQPWAQRRICEWEQITGQDSKSIIDSTSEIIANYGQEQMKTAIQGALTNDFHRNEDVFLAGNSPTESFMLGFGKNQGIITTKYIYKTLGSLAKEFVPYIRGVLEAIFYGVFLIVVLVALFPDARGVVSTYVKGLLWVQLWNPIFAIVNMTSTIAHKNMLLNSSYVFNDGLSLSSVQRISDSSDIILAITGLVMIMVPGLAWGILKGGEVAMGGILSSLTSRAERILERTSMGNVDYGNVRYDNIDAHKYNFARVLTTGQAHNIVASQGQMPRSIPTELLKAEIGNVYSRGATTQFKNTMTAVHNKLKEFGKYFEKGDVRELVHQVANSIRSGSTDAYRNFRNLVTQFALENKLGVVEESSIKEMSRTLGITEVNASGGLGAKAGGTGVNIGISRERRYQDETSDEESTANRHDASRGRTDRSSKSIEGSITQELQKMALSQDSDQNVRRFVSGMSGKDLESFSKLNSNQIERIAEESARRAENIQFSEIDARLAAEWESHPMADPNTLGYRVVTRYAREKGYISQDESIRNATQLRDAMSKVDITKENFDQVKSAVMNEINNQPQDFQNRFTDFKAGVESNIHRSQTLKGPKGRKGYKEADKEITDKERIIRGGK